MTVSCVWTWPRQLRLAVELRAPDVELLVWAGDGRTRAAWVDSQSGRVLLWARVGEA